ncbi:MAG: hypothetical protein ACR2OX_02165 [Methyloligellaceae bacterium]
MENAATPRNTFWTNVTVFVAALHILRIPVVVAAVAGVALAFPPQSLEIYRSLAQAVAMRSWKADELTEVMAGAAGIVMIAACTLLVSRLLLGRLFHELPSVAQKTPNLVRATAAFVAALPVLGLSFGLFSARVPLSDKLQSTIRPELINQLQEYLGVPSALAERMAASGIKNFFQFNDLLVAAGFGLLGFAALLFAVGYFAGSPGKGVHSSTRNRYSWAALATIAAIVIVIVPGATYVSLAWSETIGPLAVICAFFICLLFNTAILSYLSDRYHFPFVGALIFAALTFAFFDLNDNHEIRQLSQEAIQSETGSGQQAQLPTLKSEFQKWLTSRPDLDQYRDRGEPYPVYLVAAQGGGIYAALQTTSYLGRLQDRCPAFASHLFAVSGVSGGAVGATVFSSMLQSVDAGMVPGTCARPQKMAFSYAEAAERLLSQDLLSSLIAGGLFPDFFQRFLPVPIAAFDRARAQELRMEQAWDKVIESLNRGSKKVPIAQPNPLRLSYLTHWDAKGSRPALLLNTTDVASGRRRIIAPFRFEKRELEDVPAEVARRMPLITAAVLSARFPWITPAGWFRSEAGDKVRKVRVADGGYFENSGVSTLQGVLNEIEEVHGRAGTIPFVVRVLALTSRDFVENKASTSFEEMLSPVRALLNTRAARAKILIEDAKRRAQSNRGCGQQHDLQACQPGAVTIFEIPLSGYGYDLPLGWQLSTVTRFLIRAQDGDKEKCERSANLSSPSEDSQAISTDCVNDIVFRDLNRNAHDQ